MPAGVQTEWARRSSQPHSGFLGRAAALAIVAGMAAGHQILPGSLTGARPRHDMVERKLGRRQWAMAILAGITIPHQDVLAGKSTGLVRDAAIFEQPDHGRHTHGVAR